MRSAAHGACCVTAFSIALTWGVFIGRSRCSLKSRPSCPCFSRCSLKNRPSCPCFQGWDFFGVASRPAQGAGHPQIPILLHTQRVSRTSVNPAAEKWRFNRHVFLAPRDVLALLASKCTLVMQAHSRGLKLVSRGLGCSPRNPRHGWRGRQGSPRLISGPLMRLLGLLVGPWPPHCADCLLEFSEIKPPHCLSTKLSSVIYLVKIPFVPNAPWTSTHQR
jgi:hypothetical protein